jgi:hypothetical protein
MTWFHDPTHMFVLGLALGLMVGAAFMLAESADRRKMLRKAYLLGGTDAIDWLGGIINQTLDRNDLVRVMAKAAVTPIVLPKDPGR